MMNENCGSDNINLTPYPSNNVTQTQTTTPETTVETLNHITQTQTLIPEQSIESQLSTQSHVTNSVITAVIYSKR